ncbi:hypothetical protein [Deinococcus aquiradiocola]|uniref:Uncharacterized protein n=1 Tax=Deinococcus aquiradiocola TaxID=393059 RepID=A0A917P4Y1_9DEIO|nr:hypothetical protein [Deinococcus aquiradiocola]GGJ62040.1 hypothetical protein GCM10008939_02320 [Deinococcus aquiradiocola]
MNVSSLSSDPYRDWLRQTLSPEMGLRRADTLVQAAVTRRGWPAMQPFGPREVVAVLQDMYGTLREDLGDARADKWLEAATQSLSLFMQTAPAPVKPDPNAEPVRAPVKWGRRAHDLPLLLARVHSETAQRSLDAIRVTPELAGLERAAEWDVQATHAELRRWEAEDRLSSMRAEHARAEMAEQVRSARAQERLLDLTVRELESELKFTEQAQRRGNVPGDGRNNSSMTTQLAHNRLMLTQTRAFLEVFAPLADEQFADVAPLVPDIDLEAQRLSISVQLHPNVLRARHTLNYAEWQAGDAADSDPRVREAQQALAQVEREAAALLQDTLNTARQHQMQFSALRQRSQELERRVAQLSGAGGDPLSLARVQFEAQQLRAAIRVHADRLLEALGLLDALGGN